MTKEDAIREVVNIAIGQIGYLEKASAEQLDDPKENPGTNNFTKYARDLDALGYFNYPKQGVEWCAVFVHWCFMQAFGMTNAQKMLYCGPKSMAAGCWLGADYFRGKNAFYKAPNVGDQIFFGKAKDEEHTGIVVDVKNGYVFTVEGNSSNAVKMNQYKLGNDTISGYGRPDWSVVANGQPANVCSVWLNVLRKGDEGDSVKAIQAILEVKGYSCGRWGCDGDFGGDTEAAVRALQKAKKLDIDGIVGKMTWNALLN